jgi:hypothetical protein
MVAADWFGIARYHMGIARFEHRRGWKNHAAESVRLARWLVRQGRRYVEAGLTGPPEGDWPDRKIRDYPRA